jgi:hypothetical protein
VIDYTLTATSRPGGEAELPVEGARVRVTAERQESPPRFTRFPYRLEVATDEPPRRVELLHPNVRKLGTASGTLAEVAEVEGELVAVESFDV